MFSACALHVLGVCPFMHMGCVCTACALRGALRAVRVHTSALQCPCSPSMFCMCPGCTLEAHCSGLWGGVGLSAGKRILPGAVPSAVRQRTKGPAMGGRVAFLAPHASPYGNGWATTVLCCCSRRRPALAADRPWHRCKHRDSIPSELKVCSAAAVHKGHRRRRNGKSEHTGGVCVGGATGVPGEG